MELECKAGVTGSVFTDIIVLQKTLDWKGPCKVIWDNPLFSARPASKKDETVQVSVHHEVQVLQ